MSQVLGSVRVTFLCLVEGLSQILDCERHSEKIKCIPGPCDERNEEKHPLLQIEQSQKSNRILHFGHRRLQCSDTGRSIATGADLLVGCWDILALLRAVLFVCHGEVWSEEEKSHRVTAVWGTADGEA
jgi:hypothetical protein